MRWGYTNSVWSHEVELYSQCVEPCGGAVQSVCGAMWWSYTVSVWSHEVDP